MFVKYNILHTLALLFSFSNVWAIEPVGHNVSDGSDGVMAPECEDELECVRDITKLEPSVVELCGSPRAIVQSNGSDPERFLVSCDCECTSHDNFGWLVDMRTGAGAPVVQKTALGRVYTANMLSKAPVVIRDGFSSHPFCEVLDSEKLQSAVFISLMKLPTGAEDVPYCYYPAYVRDKNGVLKIETDTYRDGYGRDLMLDLEGDEASVIIEALRRVVNKKAS